MGTELKEIEYVANHKITVQEIHDIVCTIPSAIRYWGYVDGFMTDKEIMEKWLNREAIVVVDNEDDDKRHIFKMRRLITGLSLYHDHNYIDYDEGDVDQIVQLALFGEVRYA